MALRYSEHAEQLFLKLLSALFSAMIATMLWVGKSVMDLNENVALVIQRVSIQGDNIKNIEIRTMDLEKKCR